MAESEGGFMEFRLGDLFEIKGVKQSKCQKDIPTDINGIPYIVQSTANNMFGRNVNRQWLIDNNEPPQKGNAIVLGVTLPAVSYQPIEFGASQVITARSTHLNEHVGIFFATIISKHMARFSYQEKPGIQKYKNLRITLPVTKSLQIDYAYMERFIQEITLENQVLLDKFLFENGYSDCSLTDEERQALIEMESGNMRMMDKTIKEIFSVVKGKRLTKESMIPGTTNFIGASATDNGITNRISNNKHIHSGNKITVTYNGSVGESFYQPFPFWASDDVNVLYPKENLSESQCLFFLAPLRKKGKRYGYAFKWAKEIMEQDSICVPIKSDGSIDYVFMETYINALKKQCVAKLKTSDVFASSRILSAQTKLTEEDEKILILDTSDVSASERFTRFLPLYSIKAACGPHEFNFSEEGLDNDLGWIDASEFGHRLNKNMFVVQAVGHSMEPNINDGDYCVFEWYTPENAGSRDGKIVLAKDITGFDDDYSGRFTIKKYYRVSDNLVELRSINAGHPTFMLEPNEDYEYRSPILAIFVDKLKRK